MAQEPWKEPHRSKLLLEINNAITSTLEFNELFLAISRSLHLIFEHDCGLPEHYSAEKNEIRGFAQDPPKGVKVAPKGAIKQSAPVVPPLMRGNQVIFC